jgi:hypothetical protein
VITPVVRLATRCGLWLAALGTALQLIGLSWDALLHHFDPTLAEREDVVSLTNPSHLLLVAGMGMTAAGLVVLLLDVSRGARTASSFARTLAGGALGLLLLQAGVVGWYTGALTSNGHSHGAAAGAASAVAGGSTVMSTPIFGELRGLIETQGIPAALDRLEAMAAKDPKVLNTAHDYAHAIGQFSYGYFGSVTATFGQCRETFQSGCYHGVLEAYLEENPKLTPDQIAELCDVSVAPGASNVLRFQCIHGLGHGLTASYEHDIYRALRACDFLRQDWDRGSCYSGVFMENIIFAMHQLQAQSGGGDGHDHGGAGHRYYLEPQDPLYPCNVLDEKYKPECFVMKTSAILLFNGQNFKQAAAECDRAGAYVHLCYQSIGRDVSSHVYRNPKKALPMCMQGDPRYRGYCLIGAAKNMIDVTWKTDEARALCKAAPADYKDQCYTAIGEQIGNIFVEVPERTNACLEVEREFYFVCARGAGMGQPN